MIAIIQIQIQILILVAIGFIAAKKGVFGQETRRDMTNLVIYVILPCNIFHSFETALTLDVLRQCAIVLVISVGAQVFYMLLNKFIYIRIPQERRIVMKYATIVNNAGFMGLPVIGSVFGATGTLYGSIMLIPMRLSMWTVGLSLFTSSNKKQQFKQLATHPAIWAVILGFAYLFAPFRLPEFLSGAINVIGSCLTAMSMIVVGSILSDINFKTVLDKDCFYYSAVRLLIIPAVIFAVLRLIGVDPIVTGAAVLSAAMPSATVTAMLAKKYGADAEFASKIIFISTLLSLVTLPLIAAVLTEIYPNLQ